MARLNHVKSFRGTTKTADGNLKCEHCGDTIKPGDGYRWWANKMRHMRSSTRRIRCMKSSCTPRPSEMKPGRTGQILAIGENLDDQLKNMETFESVDDFQSIMEDIAGEVRAFGEEISEGADAIEEGFGHETYQSQDLRERAEAIESAADEMDSVDLPEPDEHQCSECDGSGEVEVEEDTHDFEASEDDPSICDDCGMDEDAPEHDTSSGETQQCESCSGSGHDLDSWREDCAEKLQDAWSEAEGAMYG